MQCRRALLAAVLLAASSLGLHAEPLTVDGSSPAAYERSVKAMADSLPAADREAFGRGLLNLILTEYPPARGATGLAALQYAQAAVAAAPVTLAGRSLDEILARGRSLDRPAPDRRCLRGKVLIGAAGIRRTDFGHDIEMTITNHLAWAISGVRIGYRVLSPGRSVPWIEETFALLVPGGIEPGESRTIRTSAFPPQDAPEALLTEAEIVDVADPGRHLLIGDVRIMGWPDSPSDLPC